MIKNLRIQLLKLIRDIGALIVLLVLAPIWSVQKFLNNDMEPQYWKDNSTGDICIVEIENVLLENDHTLHVVYMSVNSQQSWAVRKTEFYGGRFQKVD
jgi:hypothetical protein